MIIDMNFRVSFEMRKYITVIAAALILAACEKSHLEDNLPQSTTYLITNGTEEVYIVMTRAEVCKNVYAYCGGYYGGNPTVRLEVEPELLEGTQYNLLPENTYDIDSPLKMSDKKATFTVTFFPSELKGISKKPDYSDLSSYAIPLVLKCDEQGYTDKSGEKIGQLILIPSGHLKEKTYPQSDMLVSADSYSQNYPSINAVDGNVNTWWESATLDSHVGPTTMPVTFDISLNSTAEIVGFELYRYPNVKTTEQEKGYIEISTDGKEYEKLMNFELGNTSETKTRGPISLYVGESVKVKYVRFVWTYTNVKNSTGRYNVAAMSEINLLLK